MAPRHRKKRVILIAITLFFAFLAGDYWLYPALPVGGKSHNRQRNGLWLRYTWYFGERQDFQRLSDRMREGDIRYSYFHVRFIKKDGSLNFRYPAQARLLNSKLEKLCPDVLRVAWIYVGNRNGEGQVDLSQTLVRARMIEEAKWLTETCGFDGIQWDYEICDDGDENFIKLLRETRQALPGRFVSIAAPTMYTWPLTGFSWSQPYAKRVATLVDQIAVMAYDTGLYFPRLYANHVQDNLRWFSQAVGANAKVILGLPTYWDGPTSHNPRAENLRNALRAAREADWPPNCEGVALFADYTTDDREWSMFIRNWVSH